MFNNISGKQNEVREDLPLLISVAQAAKTLGISPRSLWTQTRSGIIPSIRLGRRVMYSPSSLQDWVARNTFIGGSKNGEHN
jgi:predicted DNA-binding transcriptional regulator AlpA